MMVSKVAVIALVAIFAVPILLGYGLNLSEQTVTEYKPEGESVNVTPLLMTGTAYSNAYADVYRLNTDFDTSTVRIDIMPIYESKSNTLSSLKMYQAIYTLSPGQNTYWTWSSATTDFYVEAGDNVTAQEFQGGTIYRTINNFKALHYYKDDNAVDYWWGNSTSFFTPQAGAYISFTNSGTSDVKIYLSGNFSSFNNTYVNFAGGFHFEYDQRFGAINLPDNTKSVLFSIDLDSITAANYDVNYVIGDVTLTLTKTTTGGVVNWSTTQTTGVETYTTDLYYNPSGSNVYQFVVDYTILSTFQSGGYTYHEKNWHVESRYVGGWPTLIGAANYFLKYEADLYDNISNEYYNNITISGVTAAEARTPTMRLDSAEFRAFAYNIIEDQTYTPSDFKANPTTTISQVSKAGSSIVFGGQTYTVDKDGNITLGIHKISTNGLKLESVPVATGYENRINGYAVSITPTPSTIQFIGQWGASVSTVGNVTSSYTHTEWTPGEFAWDGLDQNFLMVGLLAALGVFIALGIAFRKVKSALFALLVVCGGAVLLFFTML